MVWASPDCTTYSIATHRHRTLAGGLVPKTDYAAECDRTNLHLWSLIDELIRLGTKYYFVENPMGRMRHMSFVSNRPRFTTDYCAYGAPVRKRTDIWSNHPDPRLLQCAGWFVPHKHEKHNLLPRNYLARGEMPTKPCQHIAEISEEPMDEIAQAAKQLMEMEG